MKIKEFLEYSRKAHRMVGLSDPRSPLRYGQALFYVLSDEFTDNFYQTENDFFYWSNDRISDIDLICLKLCDDYES